MNASDERFNKLRELAGKMLGAVQWHCRNDCDFRASTCKKHTCVSFPFRSGKTDVLSKFPPPEFSDELVDEAPAQRVHHKHLVADVVAGKVPSGPGVGLAIAELCAMHCPKPALGRLISDCSHSTCPLWPYRMGVEEEVNNSSNEALESP